MDESLRQLAGGLDEVTIDDLIQQCQEVAGLQERWQVRRSWTGGLSARRVFPPPRGRGRPKMKRPVMKKAPTTEYQVRLVLLGALLLLVGTFCFFVPGRQTGSVLATDQRPPVEVGQHSSSISEVAEVPARYSFASALGTSHFHIAPGARAEAYVYFYNIDGNRTTHITLQVAQASGDWEVKIDQPAIDIEPALVYTEEIGTVPQGAVLLNIPGRGYTLGKAVTITIAVPQPEKLGAQADIEIAAQANWPGQENAGAVICQERSFHFTVDVLPLNG